MRARSPLALNARARRAVLDVPWANSLADIRETTLMLGEKLGAPDKARAMLAEMDAQGRRPRASAPHPARAHDFSMSRTAMPTTGGVTAN